MVLEQLKERVSAGEVAAPEFYLACGTQDSLMGVNRSFRADVEAAGFAVSWDEEDRGHDWDFWDSQIKKVIDWLPLGRAEGGMGSGNVTKDL